MGSEVEVFLDEDLAERSFVVIFLDLWEETNKENKNLIFECFIKALKAINMSIGIFIMEAIPRVYKEKSLLFEFPREFNYQRERCVKSGRILFDAAKDAAKEYNKLTWEKTIKCLNQ